MGNKVLDANLEYIVKNKARFLKEHRNKYVLVFEEKIEDSFDTYEKAAEEGVRRYGLDGNFLVYHLVEQEPLNFIMEAAI